MNGRLPKLCCKPFLVEVDFGQKFDGIFTPVPPCGMMASRIHVVVLGTQKVEKDLSNEIDDGTAKFYKFTNDFKFASSVLRVCVGRLANNRPIGDGTKIFTQKRNPLADDVSGGKNNVRLYREESLGGDKMRENRN